MSLLVDHARRELQLIGEEEDVINWMVAVVEKFASYGHSGGSAEVCIPRLNQLLLFENLSALTNDPDEWIDRSVESGGHPMWQSKRNPQAFSEDGGQTYYLLSERENATKPEWVPFHRSVEKREQGVEN